MYIELVAQLLLIHYHKWVVQQVKTCIKDYTYKTLTSFGCLQFIITLWLPFCNINNDYKEEAGSVIQSKLVQCGVWGSNFILTAAHHLLSLMLHAVKEKEPHLRKSVTCATVANLTFLFKISLLSLVYWWQIYFTYWFFLRPNRLTHSGVTKEVLGSLLHPCITWKKLLVQDNSCSAVTSSRIFS